MSINENDIIKEQNEIQDNIYKILSEHFGIAPNMLHTECLFDIGGQFDACDMVYLIHFIENEYSIVFTERDFEKQTLVTINGLVRLIHQKQNMM